MDAAVDEHLIVDTHRREEAWNGDRGSDGLTQRSATENFFASADNIGGGAAERYWQLLDIHSTGNSVEEAAELVGGGYDEFWKFKGRYRVCKGSRASKKSKTAALNTIVRTMAYPLANTLVIRKYFSTLRDSFYKELKWAVATLGVETDS